jgi:hypothetical protein
MSQVHLLNHAAAIILHAVSCLGIAFALGVSFFWPWWKTDLGWTVVLEAVAISVVLFPYDMHTWFNIRVDTLPWLWEQVLGTALVGLVLIWRFVIIWIIQRYDPPAMQSGRYVNTLIRRRRKAGAQFELEKSDR